MFILCVRNAAHEFCFEMFLSLAKPPSYKASSLQYDCLQLLF